ncbi:MAG TPA: TonB-dependent receptor [Puia sp.]|nr:TonB-dependent receptor [Puia sp.]
MNWKILLLPFVLAAGIAAAQDGPRVDSRVSLEVKDMPWQDVLSLIGSKTNLRFDYDPQLLPTGKLSFHVVDMPVSRLLDQLFRGTGLSYTLIGRGVVLRGRKEPVNITVSGFVRDGQTGEWLIGASIFLPGHDAGAASNDYGFYSLTVPAADSLEVGISYVGYQTLYRRVSGRHDLALTQDLERNEAETRIEPMTLSKDRREENVTRNQTSVVELNSGVAGSALSVGGSGDLVNSLQLVPGVQIGIDGSAGYSVRGGNAGQNLVLLDEATIYNPSHLFGLAGIFPAEAVKYAEFLRGGFPAQYGDHLSSVLNIAMKDGNSQQQGASAQMGTIVSGLQVYGPLSRDHSSYFVSARRSLIDLWAGSFATNDYFSNYYFFDINAKLNFRVSGRDRLLFSFYRGRDQNGYSGEAPAGGGIIYDTHFGNLAGSIRWNHVLSPRLFVNSSLIYNHYEQFLSATQGGYFAQLYSGIRDTRFRSDLSFYVHPGHRISAGIDLLSQVLSPASLSDKIGAGGAGIDVAGIPSKNTVRSALYAGDEIHAGDHWVAYAGIRGARYDADGVSYFNAEPRLSLLYLLNSRTSLKASYSRTDQYLHLVQSYNASFPAEIWVGSSPLLHPQTADEYTAGIFRNIHDNSIQASLEVYYKNMLNQSLFKGVTSPVIDNSLENKLIFGRGWSYGAEWMIRKNRGRWKGWLSYSLAYAWQQFDSLNGGKAFPFALDRRHSVAIATTYELNMHWKASATFYAASGRAFTLATPAAGGQQNPNPLYEDDHGDDGEQAPSSQQDINNYRLSPYNRLDLGLSYNRGHRDHAILKDVTVTLTVYNVYARYNAEFAYRTIDPLTGKAAATQITFIPVIPSLTVGITL